MLKNLQKHLRKSLIPLTPNTPNRGCKWSRLMHAELRRILDFNGTISAATITFQKCMTKQPKRTNQELLQTKVKFRPSICSGN